jgi:uncharacterized protein
LGRTLARFHAAAATGPGVDEYCSRATVASNWDENFDQMAPFVGQTIAPEINEHIRVYVQRFLDEGAALNRRVIEGRIRDGNGDLHAASIYIEDGRIRLFDSLQFAPRFRCADVAAEVAVLAMNFEHYGRADLAWWFVDSYVRASGDSELLTLLHFYACYRAYMRSLRLAQAEAAPDQARLVAESRAYFDLAWAHAGGCAKPTLVRSMGLPDQSPAGVEFPRLMSQCH